MGKDIETFIAKLDLFCDKSFEVASKHREEGRIDGLAFYYFGRCVSCFMGVKTLLFSLNLAGSQKDFAEQYINSFPKTFPRRDVTIAEKYIKETHMAIRFVLFQNFYSQTEFTYRIIQREKLPGKERRNPFKLISETYNILDGGIPEFLNDIRNSIHNNGHYFPDDKTDWEYTYFGKTFKFIQGKTINDVTMQDILTIVDYVLDENIKLFEIKELAEIKFE